MSFFRQNIPKFALSKSLEVAEVKTVNQQLNFSKILSCTHQKDSLKNRRTQTKTQKESQGYIFIK